MRLAKETIPNHRKVVHREVGIASRAFGTAVLMEDLRVQRHPLKRIQFLPARCARDHLLQQQMTVFSKELKPNRNVNRGNQISNENRLCNARQ